MNLIFFFLKHQTTSFFGAYISKIKPSSFQHFFLGPPSAASLQHPQDRFPGSCDAHGSHDPHSSPVVAHDTDRATAASPEPRDAHGNRDGSRDPHSSPAAAHDADRATATSPEPRDGHSSPPAPRHSRFVSEFQLPTVHFPLYDFNFVRNMSFGC